MNPMVLFLNALGQAFSAHTLYGEEHPMRRTATTRLHSALIAVLKDGRPLRLSFLDGEVIAGSRAMTELRGWEWGGKLSVAGIQRLEIAPLPAPVCDDLEAMLAVMLQRLLAPGEVTNSWARGSIRFGPVAVADIEQRREANAQTVRDAIEFSGLAAEIDAVNYVHAEVESGRAIPMAEVEGIVRALAVTIKREQGCLLPLLDIRQFDEYTTSHCCNVAMLSMGLADQLGLSDADTRAIGTAALLHDIGKTKIPHDLLTKPGKLTPEERLVIQRHPVEGARILTQRGLGHGLAATVAYEHHVWFTGQGGYPVFDYPRQTHYASRIVHVADIYDAVSSKRPYHDAWPRDKTLGLIRSLAGTELDPHIAAAFLTMAEGATEQRYQVSEQAA
ncbi:MAG TPA: HD domain-containing phosphohydrolase [Gemmatimonadaceae bacterium]|nr:HD domain-containing phosphohydrolase [Gemmatimonadaceae bacterium]